MFPMAKRRIGDDLRLPGEKLGGGSGWDHFPASRREQTFGLVDLAQALLSRLCHLKDIGEEVAVLSLGQCETVVKYHESPRRKSSRGRGIQGHAVRFVLMGFLLALLPLRGLHQHSAVARDGVQHAVEFFENILPVANGIDAQDVMKRARHFNRVLMGEDVAHLMAEHAAEFVVSAKEGDHLARDINASGAHAERVHYRGINKDDAKLQLCGRELRENAIRNYVEVIGEV